MTGRKRSETAGQGTTQRTLTISGRSEVKLNPRAKPPTGQLRQAFCPVCGRTAGVKRLKYPYERGEGEDTKRNYWLWLQQRDKERGLLPGEPFGVIQEIGAGKGHSFRVLGYFNPSEDIDGFYPLIKARFLGALHTWYIKGWITADEVKSVIGDGFNM